MDRNSRSSHFRRAPATFAYQLIFLSSVGGAFACSENAPENGEPSGGVGAVGGTSATGGAGVGGTSGANSTGGRPGSGGRVGSGGNVATGGQGTGGAAPGGAPNGGSTASGGAGSGGMAVGGMAAGGMAAGGAGTGGAGGRAAGGGGMAMGGAGAAGAPTGGMTAAGGSGVGGSGSTGQSAGCGKAPTIASNMYNNGQTISIMAGSMQRRYILNVPTDYDNSKPYKLIIAFHQLDGNDKQMYQNGYYHLLDLSDNNAIFVAPNGQKNGTPCSTTGNGDGGCGWPNGSNSDIALADAVVAQVQENFCVDTNRIFATGWSYGGSMSYKTACERGIGKTNGYIRGIAVYSGAQLSGNCTPNSPVAYYGSHGDSDSVLGYDGGVTLARNFATANGCTWATPTKVTSGSHMCTDIAGCPTGNPVKFCSFDGDHTPDPRDPNQGSSWQYQVVWDFFDQF